MKNTQLPAVGLALLLTACGGGSDTTTGTAPDAFKSLRSGGAMPADAAEVPAQYSYLVQYFTLMYFGVPAAARSLDSFPQTFNDQHLPQTVAEWSDGYGVNADLTSVLDGWAGSFGAQQLYVDNAASFVQAIYQNLFNRYAEPAGLAYWADLIERGIVTRAKAALLIASAAQGRDAVVLRKKIQGVAIFTGMARTETVKLAYGIGGYTEGARSLLGRITPESDMAVFAGDISAFVREIEDGAPQQAVIRYVGYNRWQGAERGPQYMANYRYAPLPLDSSVPPDAGTLTYGIAPHTIRWTHSDATGFNYGAPVTASVALHSVALLPVMQMLCGADAGGQFTRSTDVLVLNFAWKITDASEIAGQRFNLYRENCADASGSKHWMQFDVNGNATLSTDAGTRFLNAEVVNRLLDGQAQEDAASGVSSTYAAYLYTRRDGAIAYFIVQRARTPQSRIIGVWSQE